MKSQMQKESFNYKEIKNFTKTDQQKDKESF